MKNKQQEIIKEVLLNAVDNFFNGSTMDLLAHLFTCFKISQNTQYELFYRNTYETRQMLLAKYEIETLIFNVDIKQDHQFLTFDLQTGYLKGIYNVDILELIKDELNDFSYWVMENENIANINELNKQANAKANIDFFGIDYV